MTTQQRNPQNPAFYPVHGFVFKPGLKIFCEF